MSSGEGMKGQFFIVGALLICALLYVGMAPLVNVVAPASEDASRLAENMGAEMPHALNIGVNSSDPAGVLYNFTEFSRDAVIARGIDMNCLWVVLSPDSSGLNATAANFMGEAMDISIEANGTQETLGLSAGGTNSTTFSVPGYTYVLVISHDYGSYTATVPTNKTTLYAFLSLERGGDVLRKEILA